MEDWQQRVIEEKEALDKKLTKLQEFLGKSAKCERLPSDDKVLLVQQEMAMRQYSDILGERVAAFDN